MSSEQADIIQIDTQDVNRRTVASSQVPLVSADTTDPVESSIMPGDNTQRSPSAGSGTNPALVRPRRRVIGNMGNVGVNKAVSRNYAVSSGVKFTNFVELKNDMISPEFAQELIEELMVSSGIDMSNGDATKMTEDILFTFYVENAASQKTGHEKIIDVYGVELDMMTMLRTLVAHSVTPRRFTRGLADRIYDFLRHPENQQLRTDLVSRYALDDPDHAPLAFDGSTHITNLTTEMRQIANMLASRGIYENAASIKNASERTTFDGVLKDSRVHSGTLHNGV